MIPPIKNMQDAFSLKGKNAVITGGNRGLGLAESAPHLPCHGFLLEPSSFNLP